MKCHEWTLIGRILNFDWIFLFFAVCNLNLKTLNAILFSMTFLIFGSSSIDQKY